MVQRLYNAALKQSSTFTVLTAYGHSLIPVGAVSGRFTKQYAANAERRTVCIWRRLFEINDTKFMEVSEIFNPRKMVIVPDEGFGHVNCTPAKNLFSGDVYPSSAEILI